MQCLTAGLNENPASPAGFFMLFLRRDYCPARAMQRW
jgi:hypothetical protein